ncbi:TonB-dependent receptor [Limibacter armeniacum]|uniref:SusC/RagA family TonB-linked outer membrane protein n=1 Tax=Limibacter armeniacum TaxID=466084 RepID=UPI002FE5A6D5
MKKLLFTFICALMVPLTILAQDRTITGTITDENNESLPGVSIVIKGTTSGTTTDLSGKYTLKLRSEEDILTVSYIGYLTKEIQVGNRSVLDLQMEIDAEQLEEVVVVGYGSMEKKDVTGAMSSVTSEGFNKGAMTSADQLIQGKVAGVMMTPASGEPGGGVNIRVRGGTSLTASNEPLYVIDGFPIDNTASDPGSGSNLATSGARNPLNSINPADIESIDILKDASATAIYGSRGANGVIIITTKKGKEGKTAVNYDGYLGVSNIAKKLDLLTADEYRSIATDAIDQGGNTDWQDVMTRQAMTQSHNLSITGGNEKTQVRVSLNYFDQEGIIINSGVERMTGRMNLTQKVNDRMKIQANLMGSFVEDNNLPFGTGSLGSGGVINNMLMVSPLFPQDFTPTGIELKNPYLMATMVNDFTQTKRLLGNISAEYELLTGLTAKLNLGADMSGAKRKAYYPKADWLVANGIAVQREKDLMNTLLEATLNYQKEFGNHRINALAGYTYQEFMTDEFGASAGNFTSDITGENNLESAPTETHRVYSQKESYKLISFLGRVNYSFMDKYVVTGTVRADGSSKLANKWGVFPAASVAWRVAEEDFLKSSDVLSDLKLRAGWGVTGSQEIPNYGAVSQVAVDPNYQHVVGSPDNVESGVAASNVANTDLKWETTSQFNIGADYEFLQGRIYGSLDYYVKNTSDLLLKYKNPQPAVVEEKLVNVGEVRNTGVEFVINTVNVTKDDFTWETGINFTANRNEVISLGELPEIITGNLGGRGLTGQYAQVIRPGEAYGIFWGPKYIGTDESGAEMFEDLNNDGEINSDDSQVIGNAQPDFTFGINNTFKYKRFDFNFFMQGAVGNDIVNNTAIELASNVSSLTGADADRNTLADAVGEGTPTSVKGFSSRFVEDGSFLRMANMTLGYTFNTTNVSWLNNLRAYVSGQNLFVLTNYSGFDPEVNTALDGSQVKSVGIDYNSYPRARTFTVGVSVGF